MVRAVFWTALCKKWNLIAPALQKIESSPATQIRAALADAGATEMAIRADLP